MAGQSSYASLSDQVLALHPSILEVFILEERRDGVVIAEEASRIGNGRFERIIDRSLATGSLNRALALVASADMNLGLPKRVSVLYRDEGVMFAALSGQRILAICAEASGFDEASQNVNRAIPTLTENRGDDLIPVRKPMSAGEAAEIARNYVATAVKSPDVSIDEVSLDQPNRIWGIKGSYRTNPFARLRRFLLQLGSEDGGIRAFVSQQRPSLAPLLIGIGIILGTLFFLVWLILLSR